MQEFATRKAIAPRLDLRQPNCLFRKYRMAVRIMKLTAILLTVACLQLSAKGITQTVTISVRNAPLVTVLKAIQKQTDFTFIISNRQLQKAKPISLTATNMPLQQVLDLCFKGQPLTYKIIDKVISIIVKEDKVDKTSENKTSFIPPQNIDVSGKVTDENGSPLQGANVVEKGKQNGTTTNTDGIFLLKGVDENGSLVISYVGFQTLTIPVNNRTSIAISIKQSDGNLQEVVINKGYYTELKKFSTGNVATVTSKDIEKQPIQNPLLALQGRVPGIEVTQLSGMNGAGVKVRIQGRNSIQSGLEPLIVIDGVPYESNFAIVNNFRDIMQGGSPLSFINPNDIESIDILKDADATSIYGSRAANGAILITTKKGKAGKTKLSMNFRQGYGKVTRHVDMMNTRQYLDMRYEAYENDGIDLNSQSASNKNYDLKLWDTTRYTDWQKELIGGTAQYTNVNVGISGGTPAMQYLISGNYNRQTTVFPGGFDDRSGGLHFNINGTTPKQKLNIQLSGSYNVDKNRLPGLDLTQQAILLAPNAPALYKADGSLNWELNAAGTSTWTNPLAYTLSFDNTSNSSSLVSNAILTYHVLPGLDILSTFGYTRLQSEFWVPFRIDFNPPESRPTASRRAGFGTNNSSNLIAEPQISYRGRLGKGRLETLIGSTLLTKDLDNFTGRGIGYTSDLVMKNLSSAPTVTVTTNSLTYKYNALFGRLGYNWNDKYLINLTARRDGSSRFGENNKFNNFWSVAGGWIFSQEKLVQKAIPFLSFGKLRASYGTTGNDQIADYSYLSLYNFSTGGILYQTGASLFASNIGNPNLEWEETRKWQCGIDLGFLDDRIIINASYVHNRSSNQLIGYLIPNTTGFSSVTRNFPATVQNTGLELALQATPIKNRSFTWTSNFNLTIPRNKLVSFPGIEKTSYSDPTSGVAVGEPLGVLLPMFHYGGVDPSTGVYLAADKDGNLIDASGFATYPDDYVIRLSANSNLYGGFQNSISYRGFQLDILFQFVRKLGPKDLYYGSGSNYPGQAFDALSNQPVRIAGNQWRKPGDNSEFARYNTNGDLFDYNVTGSEKFYSYDASFIRLKNCSLSWQLPKSWLLKAHLQNARLLFQGQNLLTITKYTGLDPETMSTSSLPPLQIWTLGVNLEL